jgi:lysophospholipase L1-like esterase
MSTSLPTRIVPQPRRLALYRLLTLALALTMSCGVAELGLRLAGYGRSYTSPFRSFHMRDPVLGWHGKPDFSAKLTQRDFQATVTHDELGFRRHEYPPSPTATRTVYVLGDSFVWGWGVGQGEVVTDQLQKLLPGERIRNLGLCASGTVQQDVILRDRVCPHLRPGDLVLLGFFANDFGDNVGRHEPGCLYATLHDGDIQLVPPDGTACGSLLKNTLKDASYLFNLLTYGCDRTKLILDAHRGRRRSSDPGDRPAPAAAAELAAFDASPEVEITKRYLGKLQQACADHQAGFVIAYIPTPAELGESEPEPGAAPDPAQPDAERRALLRCAEELGLEVIDLLPPFLAAKQRGEYQRLTFAHDMHWNPRGHALAAQILAPALSHSRDPRLASAKKRRNTK